MITLLTSDIHQKISGGNIYNSQLLAVLQKHQFLTSLEMIVDLNTLAFQTNKIYIADGILIQPELDVNRFKNHQVFFLIHLWPSKNPALAASMREKLIVVEKEICQNFNVIVTGQSSFDYITLGLGQSTKNTLLLQPGIPDYWIQKKVYPKLPRKILYLSNFIEGKGHDTLLAVMAKLNIESVAVDCYGEILSETYFKVFNRSVEQLGLRNIRYKGVVDYKQINPLLLEYDLLLHFSEYESFGMSCLEAMASGIPIVMTPTGNYENYLAMGIRGVLPNFEITEAFSQLKKIITTEAYYQEHFVSLAHFDCPTWGKTFEPLLLKLKP